MTGHAPAAWATEAALQKLHAWWPDLTISTAEIGRRLGASKNAIVGKAHRLALPGRPSPIKRDYARRDAQPTVPRVAVPTLAPLASLSTPVPAWAVAVAVERIAARPVVVRTARPVVVRTARPVVVRTARPVVVTPVKPAPAPFAPRGRTEPCCWVTTLGAKGKLPIYCDDESAPGKPYCPAHASRVYVKIRDRSEDAAHAMGGD